MRNPITKPAKIMKISKFTTLTLLSSAIVATWLITGCQSNTIYFATNTQFGIRAGVDTKQIPEVEIGYSRQEGVMMPLVMDSTNSLKASDTTADDNAKFVASNNDGVHARQDAYSVIATFKGRAGGSGSISNAANASLGVSQYFATGIAAQLLAEHGASVVGGASDNSALTNGVSIFEGKMTNEISQIVTFCTITNSNDVNVTNLDALAANTSIESIVKAQAPQLSLVQLQQNLNTVWYPNIGDLYSNYTNLISK